ncbi:TraB/GumN family protein [Neptunomonas marina]|uniref:TraB/GumN family protein n=2 Tax=Neptunomonas marina TaxID=1815562 RepID=A0A437Q8Z4_9GAMM|nr:TraB/GumN family protein [Neptunomonas marina]
MQSDSATLCALFKSLGDDQMTIRLGAAVMVALCWGATAFAASPVWKIEKAGNTLYLGGTVHVLSIDDYPLPQGFESAFNASQRLVFETDVQAMQNPTFYIDFFGQLTYPEGQTLANDLQPETMAKLSALLAARQWPAESVVHFRPGAAVAALTMMELDRLGLAEAGVDSYFSDKALIAQKPQEGLETVAEQITLLATMGQADPDKLVLHSLAEVQTLASMMADLKAAWRVGDREALVQLGIVPFQETFSELYQRLIVARNQAWLPKIERYLSTAETEFVLVGALHLIGDDGLLNTLQARGYTISQLEE